MDDKHGLELKTFALHAFYGPLFSHVLAQLLFVSIASVLSNLLQDSILQFDHVRLEHLFERLLERDAPLHTLTHVTEPIRPVLHFFAHFLQISRLLI